MRILNGGGVEMICCMLYTLNDLMTVMMMNDQTILSIIVFSLSTVVCAFPQPFVPPPEHLPLHRRTHKKKHFHGTKKITNEAGYNCTTGNEEARATEWMVWHILKLETKNCFVFF